MDKFGVIILSLALLTFSLFLLKQLVSFMLWIWQRVEVVLRSISLRMAHILGFLLQGQPGKVVIASKVRTTLFLLGMGAILCGMPFVLQGVALLVGSLVLMVGAMAVLLTKLIMLQEDADILNGFILEEDGKFRDLQGAVPTAVLLGAAFSFFLSFVWSLGAFDTVFPGTLFDSHASVHPMDWLMVVVMQFDWVKGLVSSFTAQNLWILKTTQQGQFFLNIAIPVLFVSFGFGTLLMEYRQNQAIKQIIEALRKDDCNIQMIQRRAALAPSWIKTRLIDMTLHESEPKVRRRVISVALKTPIYTFPQVYLYNLHQETDEEVKEWGLEVCHQMITNPQIQYTDQQRDNFLKSISFQLNKKKQDDSGKKIPHHSDQIRCLLKKLAAAIKQRPAKPKTFWQRIRKRPAHRQPPKPAGIPSGASHQAAKKSPSPQHPPKPLGPTNPKPSGS